MKLENKKIKYILIGISISLVLYLAFYFYLNTLTAQGKGGLGIIALAYPLVLPCHLVSLNKLNNPYICTIFSGVVYLGLGALIGFLVYKFKK